MEFPGILQILKEHEKREGSNPLLNSSIFYIKNISLIFIPSLFKYYYKYLIFNKILFKSLS